MIDFLREFGSAVENDKKKLKECIDNSEEVQKRNVRLTPLITHPLSSTQEGAKMENIFNTKGFNRVFEKKMKIKRVEQWIKSTP